MKKLFFLVLFALFVHSFLHAQRGGRRRPADNTINQPETFEGRFFNVILSNNDTILLLLKLGPNKHLENGDTLNLARTFPCSNQSIGEYYDLHDLVSEENNCVRWHTLQLIKPKDTIHFVVNLKDFAQNDTARLYFCYTREFIRADIDCNLYSDPRRIFLMRGGREFSRSYVLISKNTPDGRFAIDLQTEYRK